MIILRSKMNPFAAIWYRFINDPLQIYLTVVCFWMVLSGRMPSTRKIWSQVPRSGVVVGGTVSRKVGVDAVPVPVSARTTGGIPLADVTQVSAEEWEHETAQAPEEEEWQRENAETKALPLLKLDDDTARARETAAKAEPDGPPPEAGEADETIEPHAAASNGAVSNGAVSNGTASANGAVPDGTAPNGAVPNGTASNSTASNSTASNGTVSDGTAPNGATSNGAASNGTASNGTASNGTASNGAEPDGAGVAAEPVWADRAAVPDWEADTGPIPRVSWEPAETGWDTEALRLPERDSEDADGHQDADGHPDAEGETDADQQSPSATRPERIQPAERG
jgi:hypothetical protein